jgi:hypothetical protein
VSEKKAKDEDEDEGSGKEIGDEAGYLAVEKFWIHVVSFSVSQSFFQ